MPIQYVGGVSGGRTGSTSNGLTLSLTALTGGIGSSAVEGDLVVVAVSVGSTVNRTVGMSTSGYIQVAELYSNDDYDANLYVGYKFMGSTPDTDAITLPSGSTADGLAAAIHVYRGVDPNNPLDVAAVTATGTNTTRPSFGAITPVTSGAEIVVAGAGGSITGFNYVSTLSGFLTTFGADTIDGTVGLGYFDWTSGTYTSPSWTGGSNSAADSWASVVVALRPKIDTADLATTETSDTSDVSVTVAWTLSFAVLEPTDVAAITLENTTKFVTFAVTEPQDTALIGGARHAFESTSFEVTAFYTGDGVSVSLAATEAKDTAAISLSARHTASLAATEAKDTASIALAARHNVSMAVTEAQDTAFLSVANFHTVSVAATEAQDTASIALAARHNVALAATEAADTASISLSARHNVALATTEAADTASVNTSVYWGVTLAATEAQDTATASAQVYWGVTLAATEAQDTASIALAARHNVALAAVEAPDSSSESVSVYWTVTLASTEAADTASGSLSAWHNVAVAATEAKDVATANVSAFWAVSLAASEAQDTASIALAARHNVALAATEAQDTASIALAARHNVALAATEAMDTAVVSVSAYTPLTLAATEAKDTASGSLSAYTGVWLAASEAMDTANVQVTRKVIFTADLAVYAVSGKNAGLVAARRISADNDPLPLQFYNISLTKNQKFLLEKGSYSLAGSPARLYTSVFFYTDSEIIRVPYEQLSIIIAPKVVDGDQIISVTYEAQAMTVDFEDRTMTVPPKDDLEELPEYRESRTRNRLRAA